MVDADTKVDMLLESLHYHCYPRSIFKPISQYSFFDPFGQIISQSVEIVSVAVFVLYYICGCCVSLSDCIIRLHVNDIHMVSISPNLNYMIAVFFAIRPITIPNIHTIFKKKTQNERYPH